MSRALIGLLTLSTIPLFLGCLPRTTQSDPVQIGEHHMFRHKGECHSWLRSSVTGHPYCASPPIDVPYEPPLTAAVVEEVVDTTKTDLASLQARGAKVYKKNCEVCHQANGQGLPGSFPPIAGSSDYYGDPQNHAKIIVHGLQGEIVIQGTTWNGVMAPHSFLTDYDIASVATHERTSWGNDDGLVMPEDVAAVR